MIEISTDSHYELKVENTFWEKHRMGQRRGESKAILSETFIDV